MLIRMLVDHVSRGGNLLLNVGPTARGEFDARALARLQGMGEWLRLHARAIYGCTFPPVELEPPEDCRYTYNSATKRLYLHLYAWPFKAVHLPDMAGRLDYAQLLNDGSEIHFRDASTTIHAALNARTPQGAVTLELPVTPPDVAVPVIELFLK